MENSPIINVVKKVLPAVVSITVSKYLTIFESPFGAPGPGLFTPGLPPSGPMPGPGGAQRFKQFFAIPKGKKKIKVGGGSGFIVDPSGIILTNRHVVADPKAEYLVVTNDEKKYPIKILARDPINDIAILKIEAGKGLTLPIIELGDSSYLQLGQTAITIGNALGRFSNSISVGVVSGLSRDITAGHAMTGQTACLRGLVQTDAAVNPGNSGGPLVDIDGKVIGINAAMVMMAENIGFALPINSATKDLQDLQEYGRIRQPFLGVRYVPITKEFQEKYNLPVEQGVLVVSENIPGVTPLRTAVVPGGPASKAGIREGDIILAVNQKKISKKTPLIDIVQKFKIGDQIMLKVLRQKRELDLKLTLAEKN